SGSFVANASTVAFNGAGMGQTIRTSGSTFSYLQFNNAGGYWTLQDSMTIVSTMSITQGTLDTSAANCAGGSCNVSVGGSWVATSGAFVANSSTVTLGGLAATNMRLQTNNSPFYNLYVNTPLNGIWVMQDALTINSTLTLTSGGLDAKVAVNNPITLAGTWL